MPASDSLKDQTSVDFRRQHFTEEKVAYGDGATRSKTKFRFDLIPAIAQYAEAERYALGVEKHGEGNWKHGDADFVKSCFNHIQCHVQDLIGGQLENPYQNVGAIKWNASAILWYATHRPEIFKQAMSELQEGRLDTK